MVMDGIIKVNLEMEVIFMENNMALVFLILKIRKIMM